ncbi:MAG: hypothetical protein ABW133_20575 [Polyangiaceae bacterium]
MRGRIMGLVMLALGTAGVRPARADDKLACVKAADSAQELRSAGKLLDARVALHACARDVCPALVRNDCTRWLAEVETSMPTIVLRAQDERGEDVADVRIEIDGRKVADKLEGLPLDVDPGPHVLVWRNATRSGRQEIVVRTAEKNRAVPLNIETGARVSMATAGESVSTDRSFRPGAGAWILAGVAVAGTASFAYFGARGSAEVSDMRNECAGHCPASRVDAAHEKLIAADVSLGIAVVSAGIAGYLFWSAATPSKAMPARQVDLFPLNGGVAASWLERF